MNELRAVLLHHLKMPGVPSQLVFWILTALPNFLAYFSVVLGCTVFHMHLKICSILVHTRRSNQSIPKEINPEYSLEGMMLKIQYFGNLMWRANSLEKTLMLGKTEGRWKRRWKKMRWLDSIITDSTDMSSNKLWEMVKDRETQCAAIHGVAKGWTRLSDWTTTTNPMFAAFPHPENYIK